MQKILDARYPVKSLGLDPYKPPNHVFTFRKEPPPMFRAVGQIAHANGEGGRVQIEVKGVDAVEAAADSSSRLE